MTKYNKVNFAIALFLAICLWVYVLVVQNPDSNQSMRNVPINYLNEDTLEKEGLVVIDRELEAVTVSYSGKRSDTDTVKAGDFKVTADLEGLKTGENTVRLFVTGPQSVTIDGANPQKVKVVIDELVNEERSIDVRIVNQHSDESEPHIVQASRDVVNVRGAKSFVNKVASIRANVDSAKVSNELKALNIELIPVDKSGEIVEGVQLEYNSISMTAILHNKKTVRLTVPVTGIDNQYITREVNVPEIITIKGTDEHLEQISMIECEPVDISGIYEDTLIPVTPVLPEGIEVAMNSEYLQVKVVAVDSDTREFSFTEKDIVLEGVTEDVIPMIEDVVIDVSFSGHISAVGAALATDFSLSADIRGLRAGTHVVPLKCICKNNLMAVEYTPKEIKVIIEEKTEGDNPDDSHHQESSSDKDGQDNQTDKDNENEEQNQVEGES